MNRCNGVQFSEDLKEGQQNLVARVNQKKMESKSFFNFLSRVEWLCVSNFCLRTSAEVDVSLGPTEAGVDFGMIKFSGEISFQWIIAK